MARHLNFSQATCETLNCVFGFLLWPVNLLTKMDSARASKQRRGKLEEILQQADRNSSADQKQNIKIAFAEGYLAASPEADSRWLHKLLKVALIVADCFLRCLLCGRANAHQWVCLLAGHCITSRRRISGILRNIHGNQESFQVCTLTLHAIYLGSVRFQ